MQWMARLVAGLARVIAGATVKTTGYVPDEKQRVYYANHSSHLDFVIVWSALPPHVRRWARPVAAKDYWGGGGLKGWLARGVFNAVLIERDPARRTEDPIEVLSEGLGRSHSLIIFPEGTRTAGEEVMPFKAGIYHLAKKRPELEFLPVYLENLNRILPKGEFAPVPVLSSIVVGMPIRLEAGEEKVAFLERARLRLVELKPE